MFGDSGQGVFIGASIFVAILIWGVVFGGVGYLIGRAKGRPVGGYFLGLVFGFVGWIIVALLPITPEAAAIHKLDVEDAERKLREKRDGVPANG